ncbi:MAG: GTPase Era [Deltaproteobacteria bacterium]|nr:GTPase Era [Deltaproteobacteria bacterium]
MPAKKKRKPAAAAPRAPARAGTLALVGRPNVGKSTLLNALLGERLAITSHQPQTTRDRIAGILTVERAQYVFLDTPGVHAPRHKLGERMNDLAKSAAAEADVAIFVTDVRVRGETLDATPSDEDLAILATIPEGKPTLLVVNKVDRVQPKSLLFPLLEAWQKARPTATLIPVSAMKRDGVPRILAEAGALLPEGEPLYPPDELSDKPVRFFVSELVREQILKRTRQEVPHGVAVTVDAFEDGAKMARITVTIHVAKESHKGILIGDKGAMLRTIGSEARRRAESLLGKKVHLQTFVRATPGWFDDAARLADLGYGDGGTKRKKRSRVDP